MMITVRVSIRAKRMAVEKIGDTAYKVWVTAVPERGKANAQVIDLLADFFDVPKSHFRIVSGATSRNKKVKFTA
jgi:uncharacterized protein (TIGR00251 family)